MRSTISLELLVSIECDVAFLSVTPPRRLLNKSKTLLDFLSVLLLRFWPFCKFDIYFLKQAKCSIDKYKFYCYISSFNFSHSLIFYPVVENTNIIIK